MLHLGLPQKGHDRTCAIGHDTSRSVREGASQDEFLPPSYQPQDTPSEFLGGPLRGNIRETEKQGRRSIITHRPIR